MRLSQSFPSDSSFMMPGRSRKRSESIEEGEDDEARKVRFAFCSSQTHLHGQVFFLVSASIVRYSALVFYNLGYQETSRMRTIPRRFPLMTCSKSWYSPRFDAHVLRRPLQPIAGGQARKEQTERPRMPAAQEGVHHGPGGED
jgi:hypothetical protein